VGGVAPPADSEPPADGAPPPLARLFAIGYRQLIDSLHDRLQAQGWADVRPAYGFVLLAARDQPTSVTELAGLMGMTKQAASKLVDAMVSAGYIQRGTDPRDGRQRPVSLTGRGEELLAAVERIYAELEEGWAALIGTPQLDRMRRDLTRVLSDPVSGQLPPVRPSW
jgi:DNA-binding MarR family transcriptional regulator